ncbi:MAG: nitrous oxide reductase family maturation protein NosD [Saprospiraceae bacterium]|nr:nitrous oxide reductase family maturation protein NosD [Saprospiraceae bacterium]
MFAARLEVCPSCSYQTIHSALENASDGDQIIIKSGLYREGNIQVTKSVHLLGEGWPVLDGEGQTEILTITARHVLIEGLEIRNVGNSYIEDRAGIRLRNTRFCTIRNNRLVNTFFGIYLEHSADCVISGNEVLGEALEENSSGNAIHCWYCQRLTIRDNQVYRHRDGIYFEFVDNSQIFGNTSKDNLRYGLHFMFSNDDYYYENRFIQNGAGVAVMFSKCIDMDHNIFASNWGRASYGLLLKELTDTDIRNNSFRENTIGIYVEGCSRIDYHHNEFKQNGWALKMSGGCLDNHLQENNFIGNSFDLSTLASAGTENTFDNNYWSEYSGYDLDHNGEGDIPYLPMKLFNQIVQQTPEALILLRSLFIDLLNFSEKVSPVFTPENIRDLHPKMNPYTLNIRS